MSINSKSKVIHPNKLVIQHEALIVDKALANKIRNVKSTIQNGAKPSKKITKKREYLLILNK